MVLDYHNNSSADTGRFELAYRSSTNPNTRGSDTKLLLEGQRIKKLELLRFTTVDQQAMKLQKDREARKMDKQNKQSSKSTSSDTNCDIATVLHGENKGDTNKMSEHHSEDSTEEIADRVGSTRSESGNLSFGEDHMQLHNENPVKSVPGSHNSTIGIQSNSDSKVAKSLSGLRKSTIDIYSQGVVGGIVRPKPISKVNDGKKM